MGLRLNAHAPTRTLALYYKVLLTRGLEGTLRYSGDAETQEFLRTLVR